MSTRVIEKKTLHTSDSIATLLLTKSVVVIATAAESALQSPDIRFKNVSIK